MKEHKLIGNDTTPASASSVDTIDSKVDTVDSIVDTIDSNVGSKLDLVPIPYVEGQSSTLAFLHTSYYHVHGASFIYPSKADPVLLTSAAASWATTGNIVEVIPANTITKPFDLHWISISDISAILYGEIDLFSGAVGEEVQINSPYGAADVVRTSNFSREGSVRIQVPQQPANTRISCRFSDSTTSQRTVRVKLYGHVYGMEM